MYAHACLNPPLHGLLIRQQGEEDAEKEVSDERNGIHHSRQGGVADSASGDGKEGEGGVELEIEEIDEDELLELRESVDKVHKQLSGLWLTLLVSVL